jgi:hypothetical protein
MPDIIEGTFGRTRHRTFTCYVCPKCCATFGVSPTCLRCSSATAFFSEIVSITAPNAEVARQRLEHRVKDYKKGVRRV